MARSSGKRRADHDDSLHDDDHARDDPVHPHVPAYDPPH